MVDDANLNGRAAAPLVYPFDHEPQTGDGGAVEVAPGILWLRMPLVTQLPWINVWALADGEGWAIVDTGLRAANTTEAWLAAFSGVLGGRPVTRVFATHMHPDHCGAAGWMAERFSVRLWMSRLEYLTGRVMAADTGRSAPEDGVRFYREAGWKDESIESYRSVFGSFGKAIYPLPSSYKRIRDGDEIQIGSHLWRVVVGSGHSPEHACFYCPELRLLLSGDQILPRITSNVSVHPTEPDADPLGDWLASLDRIRNCIPDDALVLPAHNSPFLGLHARIGEMVEWHRACLERLELALADSKRAVDVFEVLFTRAVRPELLLWATGESIAHLNHLQATGRATAEIGADGVKWWRGKSA